MEVADVALLLSPAGRRLLEELPGYDPDRALRLSERLRAAGHPAPLVSAVLTQARLRAGARGRVGDLADRLLLTPDGAQQLTRPVVSARRAARYAAAGATTVADLGCGIGGDLLAFAAAGMEVLGVDRDPLTAAVAAANAGLTGHGDRVTVRCADVVGHDLPEDVDAAFVDPARRDVRGRRFDPQLWSPPLSWVVGLAARLPATGAKLAPGIAHALLPDAAETEWVSVGGDLVEAALYLGPLRTPGVTRRATLLSGGAAVTLTDTELPTGPPPLGPLGAVVYEPDPAVIRAGLVVAVAAAVDGRLIDPRLAYVGADRLVPTPLAVAFEVDEVLPFQLKRLRAALRARDVGRVVVKTRGFAADPDEVRRRLRLPGEGTEATVLLTRLGDRPVAVVARRVPR